MSPGAVGKLHDDYPACGAGYDQMTLDALGLDRDATLSYVNDNKPSYFEFGAWVKENMNPNVDIAAHNDAVTGYIHADETRAEIFGAAGLTDDSSPARDVVN